MDINDCNVDNYDDVREQTISCNKANSRIVSISSSEAFKPYHTKMEQLNDLSDEKFRDPIDSSQLLYDNQREREIQVSRMTDYENKTRKQHIAEKAPALMSTPVQCVDDNVINIQLSYDPDCPTEPELWDGNFHSVSLHSSIEHLFSNFKNIKESSNYLAKYIGNKSINMNKANNIEDLKSIGKAAWNLVVSIYSSR